MFPLESADNALKDALCLIRKLPKVTSCTRISHFSHPSLFSDKKIDPSDGLHDRRVHTSENVKKHETGLSCVIQLPDQQMWNSERSEDAKMACKK
ncbi:hypothetical protein ACHAXS_004874 [Conticribra weissflogii]